MQRILAALLVTALLLGFILVAPMWAQEEPEPAPPPVGLFDDMTLEEQLQMEEAIKEISYIVYQVQARAIARQEMAESAEELAVDPSMEVLPPDMEELEQRLVIF